MTGGMAFVYDADASFERRANPDTITWARLATPYWEGVLHDLVREHAAATDSRWSRALLDDWARAVRSFWQVVPKEMLSRLPHPLTVEDEVMVAAE